MLVGVTVPSSVGCSQPLSCGRLGSMLGCEPCTAVSLLGSVAALEASLRSQGALRSVSSLGVNV